MSTKKNLRKPEFKFETAIEALKEKESIVRIASDRDLHPRQVTRWRNQLLVEGKELFIHKATSKASAAEPDKEELLHLINQLSTELEFLKKKLRRNQ